MNIPVCTCESIPADMGIWPTNANFAIAGDIQPSGGFPILAGETISILAHRYFCPGCRTYFSTLTTPIPHKPAFAYPEQP